MQSERDTESPWRPLGHPAFDDEFFIEEDIEWWENDATPDKRN